MIWLFVVIVAVVVFGVFAWWSSGRQRGGVDNAKLQRTRKINEGRGSEHGGGW